MVKMADTPVYTAAQTHRASAPSKSIPYRTAYTGPVKNRGKDAQGRAKVSREELADFRRKYGADKTLRDLLNADKTGKLPKAKSAPKTEARPPAGPRRNMAAEAKGAETLERMKSRAERGMAVRSNEEMRDEAKGRTLGALGAAATLAGGPLARMAVGRAAAKATPVARREPEVGLPSQGRVFRSARPDAEAAKQAEYMRRVEELGLKKGGTTKAYAKGGSVRGAGCETRSKKSRYI